MAKLDGELDPPHAELKDMPFPIELLKESNLIRDIPDAVKLLLGELVYYWGKTENKLKYISSLILSPDSYDDSYQFWDRYSLIKKVIKTERSRDNVTGVNLFKLMGSSRRPVKSVRDRLIHGDIIAISRQPADHLIVISRDGKNQRRYGIPVASLRWTVQQLKIMSNYQDGMIRVYQDHMFAGAAAGEIKLKFE